MTRCRCSHCRADKRHPLYVAMEKGVLEALMEWGPMTEKAICRRTAGPQPRQSRVFLRLMERRGLVVQNGMLWAAVGGPTARVRSKSDVYYARRKERLAEVLHAISTGLIEDEWGMAEEYGALE